MKLITDTALRSAFGLAAGLLTQHKNRRVFGLRTRTRLRGAAAACGRERLARSGPDRCRSRSRKALKIPGRSRYFVAGLIIVCLGFAPGTAQAGEPAELDILWETLAPGDGLPTIPATQGDIVYLGAAVRDADGQPVNDVAITVKSANGNRLVGPKPVTGDGGYAEFNLAAQNAGVDTLTVSAGKLNDNIRLDVKPPGTLERLVSGGGLPGLDKIDDITGWATLMQAQVDYDDQFRVSAVFGPEVQQLIGQRVRVVGFMLPLDISETQKRFVLSANPPTCFFHLPGGPTTVIEINTNKGVAISYEPMVIEGRLEASSSSDDGILYRLLDAKPLSL